MEERVLKNNDENKEPHALSEEQIAYLKQQVFPIVGACIEVHKVLGPYLNEYMYQDALALELVDRGFAAKKEYYFNAEYKGKIIAHKHYCDF